MDQARIEKMFAYAKEQGFQEMEIYFSSANKLSTSVFEGEVDKFSQSATIGYSFRGIIEGKLGYAYSSILDDEAVKMLVDEAKDNASVIDSDEKVFIFDEKVDYPKVDNFNPSLEEVSIDAKLKVIKDAERIAKSIDDRIRSVSFNGYENSSFVRGIVNSHGVSLEDKGNYCVLYLGVVAEHDGDIRTGLGYRIGNEFDVLDPQAIAEEAVKEATDLLGAKVLKTGEYPVVFRNDAFADLFDAFSGVFSAENVQKNVSQLKDKLNETIASSCISVVDDPHMENQMSSSSFDAEGVPTKYKEVIKDGVLQTYLHNLKTAHKDGVKSTGNASKGSYKSTIGISPTNFYIKPSELSFDNMIKDIENGVFIISLEGLHAGLSAVSGEFSLQCSGFRIENGKVTTPVKNITVAGNFFDMIKDIEAVDSNLKFSIMGGANTGSPNVFARSLSIAGE